MTRGDPNVKTQPATFEWLCLMYRERFHLTHNQFRKMKPQDFYDDIRMLNVEGEVEDAKAKKQSVDIKKKSKQ